jgi:hypothetical protein
MGNIIEAGAEPLYIAEITAGSNLLEEGKIVRTNGRTLPESTETAIKTLLQLR